jgi:cytidine deaminase
MDEKRLVEAANQAKDFSYAPYSKFHVGAALLCADGSVYTGCNIENAAYGPSNCAERTAIFKAVSEGQRSFTAIAIISDSDTYTAPCGVCRQVMSEFCDSKFIILMCNNRGEYRKTTLGELLPCAFSL